MTFATINHRVKSYSLLFVACTFPFLVGCKPPADTSNDTVRAIKWLKVGSTNPMSIHRLTGKVVSDKQATLSFAVSGEITQVYVHKGDYVKRGTVLAQLDDVPYRIQRQAARASLENAKIHHQLKERVYRAEQKLSSSNHVSELKYRKARAEYLQAAAQLDKAKSDLRLAEYNLKNTQLIASFDGYVIDRLKTSGERVAAQAPVVEIYCNKSLKIKAVIPQRLIEKIKKGDEVKVVDTTQPNTKYSAYVRSISNHSKDAYSYPVELALAKNFKKIHPGMAVEISLRPASTRHRAIYIPAVLIQPDLTSKNHGYVFVYKSKTHRLEKRRISLGDSIDEQIQVLSGLKHADVIAAAGIPFLYHGQRVNLLEQ